MLIYQMDFKRLLLLQVTARSSVVWMRIVRCRDFMLPFYLSKRLRAYWFHRLSSGISTYISLPHVGFQLFYMDQNRVI